MSSIPPTTSGAAADDRILYPKGDRSSQPAGALQSANLVPDMLAHNLRAGLFPEKGQRIRNTIEQGLARQAWWEVKAIERLHQRSCPQSTLKHIHTVLSPNQSADVSQPTSPTPQPAPASVITNFQPPLPTRLYATLFRQASMPHLPLALPATSTPSESTRVDASTGLVYHGVRELGSELWTVERCSVEQQYLVAYYGDGDAFYASVYPVNWSGAFDCMRIKAKRWLGWS